MRLRVMSACTTRRRSAQLNVQRRSWRPEGWLCALRTRQAPQHAVNIMALLRHQHIIRSAYGGVGRKLAICQG